MLWDKPLNAASHRDASICVQGHLSRRAPCGIRGRQRESAQLIATLESFSIRVVCGPKTIISSQLSPLQKRTTWGRNNGLRGVVNRDINFGDQLRAPKRRGKGQECRIRTEPRTKTIVIIEGQRPNYARQQV